MRVLIASVSSAQNPSGVCRHALGVARSLASLSEVESVILVVGFWQFRYMSDLLGADALRISLINASCGPDALARNLWYYRDLPELARNFNADIVQIAFPMPVRRAAFPCPVVATLHDLYPYDSPENFGAHKVLFNRLFLRRYLRAADAIACVSQTTQSRLQTYSPNIADSKALTIYNCIAPLSPQSLHSPISAIGQRPFLLCVAQHRHNKNIHIAIEVHRQLLIAKEIAPETLLLVVGNFGPETSSLLALLRKYDLQRNVLFLSGIADVELAWCYSHAQLLLMPSSVEGFGLPLVEALSFGCPIVCSDIPVLREIGGDACTYVPLTHNPVISFYRATLRALADESSSPRVNPLFFASTIAQQYLQLYRGLIQSISGDAKTTHSLPVPAQKEATR